MSDEPKDYAGMFNFEKGTFRLKAEAVEKPKADEKPERFVTSDAEALHAATIRGLCAALNDAVKAAAKDGLSVTYSAEMGDGWSPWSRGDGEVTPFLLRPEIMRKL